MLDALLLLFILIAGFGLGWFARTFTAGDGDAGKVAALEEQLRQSREAETTARVTLENKQAQFDEDKKRLNEIREQMENSFKVMANEFTNKSSEMLLQTSERNLNAKKELIDKNLTEMNNKLGDIHKQSSELRASIDTSQKTTSELNETTAQLREVLSSSQQRGQWGERMVEDILQVIGLVENVNYRKQSQVDSGERPDFTFILPQEKTLNMDVKFPLSHYQSYIEADNEEAQEREKNLFLRDVRGHIKAVSGREYINPADGTLEYVMLFIPNESIYGFINREDSNLVDEALSNRVLLCSPLTLYAMLSLIHQATQNFVMNERAAEVMQLVDQFRNQWRKYIEQMDKLGNRIEGLTRDFNVLTQTRTRALEKPLDKIENITLDVADDSPKLLPPD